MNISVLLKLELHFMGDKSFITKTAQLALCQLFREISLGLKQLLSATELNLENRFLSICYCNIYKRNTKTGRKHME